MPATQSLHLQSTLSVIDSLAPAPGLATGYTLAWLASTPFTDLTTGWSESEGVYIFLPAVPDNLDLTVLQQKLRLFLRNDPYNRVRLLWIENPAEAVLQWRTYTIEVATQREHQRTSRRAYLPVRNYALTLDAGVAITFVEEKQGLQFRPAAEQETPYLWSAAYGEYPFPEHVSNVFLPLTGPDLGCLQFDFSLPKLSWRENEEDYYGYPGLRQMDVGLRLFFRDPELPVAGDAFLLASHRYPFVQEHFYGTAAEPFFPASLDWRVQLDLLAPLSRQRTHFSWRPPLLDTGFPTAYRTNRGYTIHLTPDAATTDNRLYFSPRPATLYEDALGEAPLYLMPAGKYLMQVPKYDTQSGASEQLVPRASVLCGLSGLEYVQVVAEKASFLRLVPDQPAYAPTYVSAYALLRDLTDLIESYAHTGRSLPPDTIDLDMPIEELFNEGMGINDRDRRALLDRVRLLYFPVGYAFSEAALNEFMSLEIVEDLVNWLRETLQTSVSLTAGQTTLTHTTTPEGVTYPSTAWTYFHEPPGATYYGQPDQAVLYRAENSSSEFLDYLEVPAIGLPDSLTQAQQTALAVATGHAVLAVPLLPYGAVAADRLTDMQQLEKLLINNLRYNRIRAISQATGHVTPLNNLPTAKLTGTTPQGLLATYSPDPTFPGALRIERLQLARNQNTTTIELVDIPHDAAFKAVLQSNQLFMVVSDPAALAAYFSAEALQSLAGVTNRMYIEEWLFELGPDFWHKNGTLLVFKFHDKSLVELASRPHLWSLPGDFNSNQDLASSRLQELIDAAVQSANSSDPKERKKYAALLPALTQANWTGVLAFNVAVPPGNLPDDLKALAGGIDPDLFYAQYVGIEVTPIVSTGTELESKPSSMFALIDYQNDVVPEADITGYNFHVPYLTVVFRNSLITDFAAEVQLFLEFLFHEQVFLVDSPTGENMISLQGVAERHNGKVTYAFGFSGANRFELSGKVMQEVEVIKAQFTTDPLPPIANRPDPLPITGRFSLWGRLRFVYLEAFDALSFGVDPGSIDPAAPDYLSIHNLQVTMSFDLRTNTADLPTGSPIVSNKVFTFQSQQIAFDLLRSGWRTQSLYEKFPLKFKGLKVVAEDAGALAASGYMPVNTPVPAVDLGDTWYGLEYDLNLGTAGALSGSTGMIASVLIGWRPETAGLYIGLKLPGSTGGKKEITVQGLLKIAFKSIRFESYTDPQPGAADNRGYLLKLKNIRIKFMVVSFPPSGQTEIILFGDPRTKDQVPLRKDKLLGWYAAYVKK